MCQPVAEGVIAHISVAVNEDASAGQVREHGAGISGRHMKVKGFGHINILPVWYEQNSERKNLRLHDPNLSSYQSFLSGRGSEDCVAACGRVRCDCIFADHLCAAT